MTQRVLITAGAGGIGFAMASTFAANGAQVWVADADAAAKGMTRDQVYTGYALGTSMRTFVQAQDSANMAVFLASEAARFVSGQLLAVDGHTENPDPKV